MGSITLDSTNEKGNSSADKSDVPFPLKILLCRTADFAVYGAVFSCWFLKIDTAGCRG